MTPYVGEDQISSGPMACALSAVGAVISTPYLFAKEVLADGRGLLIPFADSQALAEATLKLLTDPALLLETRRKTYQFAKSMVLAISRPAILGLLHASGSRSALSDQLAAEWSNPPP